MIAYLKKLFPFTLKVKLTSKRVLTTVMGMRQIPLIERAATPMDMA